MIAHLVLGIAATLLWPYFFLLNRTTVTGRPRHVPRNTVFVANHQSTLDSFLIAIAALYPQCLIRHRLMPWSLAAAEHFFRTPLRAWFARHMHCIPVRAAGGNGGALRRLMRAMERSVGIYFPEGRRSADGAIGRAQRGIGLVVLRNRPRVIPVAIDGMREAVRFDRFGLRVFRSIRISFGDPIDFGADGSGLPEARAQDPQRIADALMERIWKLHAEPLDDPKRVECSL